MRSQAAKEVLAGHVETALHELGGKVARVDYGTGKLKLPKKKKVLTEEQECDKQVLAARKKSPAYALSIGSVKHAFKLRCM